MMKDKNPIDILREDHDKVLKILDNLEKNIEGRDVKSSEKNITILEKEFDKHSLNKKEKALFPEIEKFIPGEGGPTGVMVREHQDLVESIKNFKESAKDKNLEKTYREIHEWLDSENISYKDRISRHDIINIPNFLPVVEMQFGKAGVREYLQHIKDEYDNSILLRIFKRIRKFRLSATNFRKNLG